MCAAGKAFVEEELGEENNRGMLGKSTVVFKGGRGSLEVDNVIYSKSRKTITVHIGECTCYKNTCDCIVSMTIPCSIIEEVKTEVKE